ncbi:FecR family protein [Steroidobacter sp.]|uniref:FecR family protein n=1 Tax=Steroidobacter sp. TaxID=1978227 RepID=UPI001A4A1C33|nr:FecR domain-containing protein [Steroidobacter sp.]MBL8271921.1 FecR domain-containing protein [Steroidobacter sp.]
MTERTNTPSAPLRREAAVWIARLHSPERNASVDAGLRDWLNESPEHRAAFEKANELWESASRVPASLVPRSPPIRHRISRASNFMKLAFAMTFVALVGTLSVLMYRDGSVSTDVGEQRILTLEDGSRISLNTATRLTIDYDRHARRVRLTAGEALFEVAKRADWPFVVTASDRTITALGTAFVVRRDQQDLAVTLVEGKIAVDVVRPVAPAAVLKIATPGQRVTYSAGASARVEQLNIDHATAWKRGQVVLESTPLSDAIAEMNRYSTLRLSLDSEPADHVRISGVFRAGDSLLFARAIAETYHLTVSEQEGAIVLSGVPSL